MSVISYLSHFPILEKKRVLIKYFTGKCWHNQKYQNVKKKKGGPLWHKRIYQNVKVNSCLYHFTALQDLEPSQLVLFVQSFGLPVQSMSKLLVCLDRAVEVDGPAMEGAVVDKMYMAQLVDVQHMRGAVGGEHFHAMLKGDQPSPPGENFF